MFPKLAIVTPVDGKSRNQLFEYVQKFIFKLSACVSVMQRAVPDTKREYYNSTIITKDLISLIEKQEKNFDYDAERIKILI